jgi:beta-glucosidase
LLEEQVGGVVRAWEASKLLDLDDGSSAAAGPLLDCPPDGSEYPDERVNRLVAAMTLDEKIGLLHSLMPALPRLGIRRRHVGIEALHGVAWRGEATVFPQAIGLGATWNRDLLERVGCAIGDELRGFAHRDPASALGVCAPVVNLLRDPRWGRNEEGYSEDPQLTSELAKALCRGLRGDQAEREGRLKSAPILKHFLAYNSETARVTASVSLRPRVLREYELQPFEKTIRSGLVSGVMPSYNLVNGRPNHVSTYLALLRSWAPDLVVLADAFAPTNLVARAGFFADRQHAYAAALRAGLDSFNDHGEDPTITIETLQGAVVSGLISEADLDAAVIRLLRLRQSVGEFDEEGADPFASIDATVIDSPAHRRLALEAARQAVVLLRNEENLLPWRPDDVHRVAIVGTHGDALFADWYSGSFPYQRTIRAALADRLSHAAVEFCEGTDRVAFSIEGHDGFLIAGCSPDGEGLRLGVAEQPQSDACFDVCDWGAGQLTLRSVANGKLLSLRPDGSAVNDQDQPNGWVVHQTFNLVARGEVWALANAATSRYLRLSDGEVRFDAERLEDASLLRLHLVRDGAEQAERLAREADVVVMLIGNHPLVNGHEGQDRLSLAAPERQERLAKRVIAANRRTAVVVVSSYPMSIDALSAAAPALLWTCHGGQDAGTALAEALCGDFSPAGRLPQTWPRSAQELGDILDYDIIKSEKTYLYSKAEPLFPFGHGLTYSTLEYSAPRLKDRRLGIEDRVEVQVEVTNAGELDSDEVVQLYVSTPGTHVPRPKRELRDFCRVHVAAGTTTTVSFSFPVSDLAFWDVSRERFVLEPGEYRAIAARSSADTGTQTVFTIDAPPLPARALGPGLVRAVQFDDYDGVRIVGESPVSGEAVESLAPGAWLLYRRADLNAPIGSVTARIGQSGTPTSRIEFRLDDPVEGGLLAVLEVPDRAGPYTWSTLSTPVSMSVDGERDVYVVFTGPARIACFTLSPPAPAGPTW